MEPQKAAQSVEEFAEDNGISRTTTYVEIREGRLRANKVGSRTIITSENAKKWCIWGLVLGIITNVIIGALQVMAETM